MIDNKTLILAEFDELKGQFVIPDSWKVERLVAIAEDDMDYYWITYDGRKLKWHTCVGGVVQLKGKLDDTDYDEFERLADLNHYDRLIGKTGVDFEGKHYTLDGYKQELMKDWGKQDKLLTDIIFKNED